MENNETRPPQEPTAAKELAASEELTTTTTSERPARKRSRSGRLSREERRALRRQKMRGRRFVSAMGALAVFVAACAMGVLPKENAAPATPAPAEAASMPARMVCGGGFARTFSEGMSATEANVNVKTSELSLQWASDSDEVVFAEDAPRVVSATEAGSTALAGVHRYFASDGDSRGLALNPCLTPSADTWIVGSQAAVGTSNELVVTNPGINPVRVTIEAYGPGGKLELGTGSALVVDGGKTERLRMDGLIPEARRLALHLSTNSGVFGASLQTHTLEGSRSGGIDFISGASAGSELTIPGVLIGGSEQEAPVLRIVNPGEETNVSVHLLGEKGSELIPGGEVTVAAGSVTDLTLAGLEAGLYSLQVEAGADVAAGVRLSTGVDATWAGPVGSATRHALAWGNFVSAPGEDDASPRAGVASLAVAGTGTLEVIPVDSRGKSLDPIALQLGEELSGKSVELPRGAVGALVRAEAPVSVAGIALETVSGGRGGAWVPAQQSSEQQASRRITVVD